MSIFTNIGIIIGIIIVFFILKYIITNWKTIKKDIYSYFINNFGSFFYICLFTLFFIFTIYPLIRNNENLQHAVFTRKLLFLFMFVIIIIYSIWIYKLHKPATGTESNTSGMGMKIFYSIQFIIIIYAIRYNSMKNFVTFPYFLAGGDFSLTYLFWIFFWGILFFFSYYLIKTYKVANNSNNITANSIVQSTFKYLCIFVITLFTTKLFFNRKTPDKTEEYDRNFLAFNTKETNLYVTYLAYFLIITNMIFLLFNSPFMKWAQIIILVIILIFVVFIILFMTLFKFTNPEYQTDGTYFNTNYIFLFILFFLSFIIFFKINPAILQSSMNYLYIIGFVFGLVVLFSLSVLFNNKENVKYIFEGAYKDRIRYGIVFILFLLFVYFISFYVKKSISTFQTKFNETNPVLFTASSILVIGLLAAVFIGVYFLINSFDNDFSYVFNTSILLGLVIICFFFFKYLTSTFVSHSSTKACPINTQLWKTREIVCFIFLIIGIFSLSFIKSTNTPLLDIGLLVGFVILGYYFGGLIYQKGKNIGAQEKENCNNFLNNSQLGVLETIKVIIMISIVVVLFFSMNIVIKSLSIVKDTDILFKYFLGLFFILLFFIYFRFSNSSFIYIVEILNNVFNKNYFSSPNTHKFTDFLFFVFIVFVFFSSMGLLEQAVISSYIQEPINYISNLLGLNDKNIYFDILNRIYKLILLVFNAIMFIPCIFNDMYLYFYTTKSTFTYILIIEFCLILFYLLYRKFINIVVKRHSERLLNGPEWLYPPSILSNNAFSTEEVNGIQANIPNKPIYNFGISFWIYIEQGISNTFLNILNYNNSPAILYKPSMNSIIVTSQLNPENTDVEYRLKGVNTSNTLVNETIKSFTTLSDNRQEAVKNQKIVFTGDIKLQTWNNIFVNYNDGVIDVFVNGELMGSNPGNMIDASTYKNLITIGNDNEDSQMKICNLCFYNKNLNLDEIVHVYNSCKNLNPPLRH